MEQRVRNRDGDFKFWRYTRSNGIYLLKGAILVEF